MKQPAVMDRDVTADANIVTTSTMSSKSNPWLDESYRVIRTPPRPLYEPKKLSFTYPKRSVTCEPYAYHRRASALRRHNKRTPSTDHKGRKVASKSNATSLERACNSCENTPLSTRRQRFFMENCTESSGPTSAQMDVEKENVSLLKEELHFRYRSVHDFHMRNLTDFAMQSSGSHKNCEAEIEALKRQLQDKDDQLEQMSLKYQEMLPLVNSLQSQLTIAIEDKKTCEVSREEFSKELLQPFFTEGQIRCILQKKKWVQWSIDDYIAAISFRSVSAKAYRYFQRKLNYPLPSLQSLRRWALKKFNIEEGFLHDVLAIMREKGKEMSSLEKIAVLCFDEMAVSSEVNFDAKLEKLIGPHGKVQVIMVRGLFSNWKQPIYYKFDQPMNKSILLEAITLCHNADYQVVVVVSDLGNRGVWKELDITPNNNFFHHPVNKVDKVFVFADVPHLLKLLRNWFLDDGLLLGGSNKLFTSEIFQTLVDISKAGDLRVAHRITDQLLNVRDSQRQSVKPAARLWSYTSSSAIRRAGDNRLIKNPEYEKLADFVAIVNNWFDVHNSKSRYGAHSGVNAFGVNLKSQQLTLTCMSVCTENMRVGSRKVLMPFQKGILVSNRSLRELFRYLQEKYPQECHYIMTRRLQQDILENFFSYVRAMGATKDHPSPYDFRYGLRWYVLGKHTHAVFSLNKNTEEDMDSTCISSTTEGTTIQRAAVLSRTLTPVASTAETDILTSTPIPGMTLHASTPNESLQKEDESAHERDDDIILTKELFSNIINLSPEELLEDSHNDETEATMDTCLDDIHDDELLFEIVKNSFKESSGESSNFNLVEEAGLEYVAGFVAHKFRTKYPALGTKDADATTSKWIQTVSKSYLRSPSAQLLNAGKIVEKYFVQFHGDYFSKESFVIQKVLALIKNSGEVDEIPDEVLQYFVKTRTYIRVREINRRSLSR